MASLSHPSPLSETSYSAVELLPGDDAVVMLDQRELPTTELYHRLETVDDAARGIIDMIVRGAPAIGISAAYAGLVLAARAHRDLARGRGVAEARRDRPRSICSGRSSACWSPQGQRPTATAPVSSRQRPGLSIEDVAACREMGRLGAARIPDGATILTHCNAGGLATGGFGTAVGVIRAAHEAGKRIRVLADETRPYLQGSNT